MGLFKFGLRQHIEEFVGEGHLYMNTLSYFRTLEDGTLRQDKEEGSAFCMQPGKAKLGIEVDGAFQEIPDIVGPIVYWDEIDQRSNVFCMYVLRASPAAALIDPQNFEFGDTFALLTDGNEFLRRVRLAVQDSGQRLQWGLVEYVDRATYHGSMGIFKKFSSFSYQSEFRIALVPGTGRAYSLRVGDLSDITLTGKLADLNSRLKIVSE